MKRITTFFALLMLVCMGAWAQETTVWFKQANDGDNVTRGTYYNKDGTVNTNAGSFVYFWKSGADEPIITLKATNNPQNVGVMARENSRLTANGNPTYEISVSEGYTIKSYYIKFINFNDASKPKTLATEFGQTATTEGSERGPGSGSPVNAEVTVTNVNKAATTFTVSSDDDKAIKIREFYVVVEETSDYTALVEDEIKPWVESAGTALFTLDPEDAAVAQVIRLYQAGPADQKTWTKDEYNALKAALQKALGAEAYLLPETGYYHVKNKAHKTYIGYGAIQGKGSGLTLYDNTDDPSTTLLFTKTGTNSYTIETTAGKVGQVPTNATDQLYPVGGSGEKFQFVVIDAAQGLFTLTCGEFPNPRNASQMLGYLHGTNWGGVVSWTRAVDAHASHWTIEKASGPVVPPVVDPVNTELQLAINVLNNVPYALYPPTFDWDAPRAYKEYKNTYGRYQLASRLAVAILARLVDYATAEDDVKAKIAKDLADKYDIANFDAVLNDLLKSYARKVVETHGEAYALYEQGDENFSRMYDALAQAKVTDTEQYASFWAAGTTANKIRVDIWNGVRTTDPAISSYSNNVWTSNDGSLQITNNYNMLFGTDPTKDQRVYGGVNNKFTLKALKGSIKSVKVWSFYQSSRILELEDGTQLVGDDNSPYNSFYTGFTIPVNGETFVLKVASTRAFYFDMEVEMEEENDPYEGTNIEKTLSDAYELMVTKLKDPKPFDASITSHIVNPNFANGTDGWNITEWGTDKGKPLTDSEGNTRPYYNYLNSWNKPNVIVDANQELTLPAGRYMLTVAGRGSSDHYREVSAASPEEFFQVYATNNQGVTRAQSIYPLEEEGENVGVFGNGWNDASVFFTMPSAGKAIVGVRAKTKAGRHWVSATRFRLTRVGDPTLFFDENQTYANKLEYDPIFEQLNQLAPVDIVLHKKMEPGKWYAMSLPANITKEQLAEKFGTGTRLAQLWGAEKTEAGAVAYFASLPIATTNYFPTCPFLIQPEKVNANHMYVFHDVVGRHDYVASGVSYGEQGATSTEWGKGGTAWGPGRGRDMRFVSNYTYDTAFDRGYNLEMSDTLKAFSAYLEAGDEEIVAVYVDGKEVILDQQLAQAARNGAALAKHYAGIPEAMINALKVTSTSNKIAALKAYRQATAEAAKAVAPSKEFNEAMAEAEELLATEHTEVEAGADAAFKEVLASSLAAFNGMLKADEIPALTEKLREEIEKFKTQIDQGLKELEAGMHLFYNIGSKKYLGGSNEWGTQASLTTHGELMGVTKLDDGKYTIETRFTNGNNFHGFSKDHRGIYFMDAAATGASLEIVCVKRGVYTISDAAGYLGYNGTNTVLGTGLTDANDANAQWIIVSEEELLKQMAEEASVKNPMDVTFLIQNPDFSRGHRDVAAWTFTCTDGRLNASNASAPADMGNYSAEANKASFDLSQELTVPNGVYVMEAQGAVTDNSGAYDGTDYPVFFANDATAPFLSMEEQHRGKSMLDLQKAFGEGKYFVEPIVVKVTDGQLTVGAKGTRTDLWATWDNFSLKFYGDVDINDVLELYGKTTGNEPTGINTVDNGPLAADGWYSIDGRKLNGKPTKKGVYVVNGKKVIVK